MYFDQKRERILLRDGRSIVTPFHFARETIKGKPTEHLSVLATYDSEVYDLHFHSQTSAVEEEIEIAPETHEHTEDDLARLYDMLMESPRYEQTDEVVTRLNEELDYFEKTNNVTFLLKCSALVQQFKEDKVVWGCGRGSSCASHVLYLLEVNDIDPIKYGIPFNELSKEIE